MLNPTIEDMNDSDVEMVDMPEVREQEQQQRLVMYQRLRAALRLSPEQLPVDSIVVPYLTKVNQAHNAYRINVYYAVLLQITHAEIETTKKREMQQILQKHPAAQKKKRKSKEALLGEVQLN